MKPSLILVSGWAMPESVLEPLADQLAADFNVSRMALPGFSSESVNECTDTCSWDSLVNLLHQKVQDTEATSVTLVGWSLGAQLCALYASRYPESVNALVTLGGNPCFVQRQDWEHAMKVDVFNAFYQQSETNLALTLRQFAGLCTKGSSAMRQQSRDIQTQLKAAAPQDIVLVPLLQRLNDDFRPVLSDVQCPVTHLLGEKDALVPVSVRDDMLSAWPEHRVETFAGGHTFFLDDPVTIAARIKAASHL
ncbi:alpha/beta fold hydrolase [Spongorhabdus nitratireducens]